MTVFLEWWTVHFQMTAFIMSSPGLAIGLACAYGTACTLADYA